MQDDFSNPDPPLERRTFASGAVSSKNPRYDLLPPEALKRIIRRFELGMERHKEAAWNIRAGNDHFLRDRNWVIERAGHAIDHSFKLIAKLINGDPLFGDGVDDDAAAIGWAGICLCQATEALHAMKPQGSYRIEWIQPWTDPMSPINRPAHPPMYEPSPVGPPPAGYWDTAGEDTAPVQEPPMPEHMAISPLAEWAKKEAEYVAKIKELQDELDVLGSGRTDNDQ